MVRRAFLVAGDEESDLAFVVRMLSGKALDRHNHRRQAAFHVGSATAMKHAVFVDARGKRRILPRLYRTGRDHVGVAGEAQHGTFAATDCPEVLDVLNVHRLDSKAAGGEALSHQLLTALILRGNRWPIDQLAGEFEGRERAAAVITAPGQGGERAPY